MFKFIKKFTKVVHVLDLEFAKQDVQPTLYAYNDIKKATQDFHPDMKIGQGSFGVVYKVYTTFFCVILITLIMLNLQWLLK
jgi:virulence-associated protein VapD